MDERKTVEVLYTQDGAQLIDVADVPKGGMLSVSLNGRPIGGCIVVNKGKLFVRYDSEKPRDSEI